jgi:hypothetical protein
VLDEGHREGLAIDMAFWLPGERVIRALKEGMAVHCRPQSVRVSDGPGPILEAFVERSHGGGKDTCLGVQPVCGDRDLPGVPATAPGLSGGRVSRCFDPCFARHICPGVTEAV